MDVDDLGLPADALGVAQIHPQQVAGEQGGLVAALARLDLEDDVLVVAGVARDEQQPQLLRQLLALLLQFLDLGGEVRVVGGEFAARSRCRPRSASRSGTCATIGVSSA